MSAYPVGQANSSTNPFGSLTPTSRYIDTETPCLSNKTGLRQPAYSIHQTNSFDASLPSSSTIITEIKPSPLKGRSWSYNRIAPALLVLIACVTGVACSLMWNFYLLIPFGPGFLASLYLFHLGCYDQELLTLAENNVVLAENNSVLKKTIVHLKNAIDQFTEQNDKLKQTLRDYISLYNKFSLSVGDLSLLETGLAKTHEQAKQRTQTVQGVITGLQSLSQNFKSFDTNLILGQQKEQFTILARHLEAFAKALSDPSRERAYQKHIELITKNERILAKYEFLVPHVKKLEKTAETFEKQNEKLKEQVDRLSKEVSKFKQARASLKQAQAEKSN